MSHQFVCCAKKRDKILNLQKLSEKGATSLNTPINKRKDKVKQICVGQYVHNNCRKNYASSVKYCNHYLNSKNPQGIEMVHVIVLHMLQQNQTSVEEHQPLISIIRVFLCGESTFNNSNHKKKSLSQGVKMVSNCLPTPNQFHETLLRICKERGDEWGECVSSRILGGFN